MMRRREFCRTTVAAAGALAFPGLMPRLRSGGDELDKIGMQLYSLRDLFLVDMVKTLRQLRDIGYDAASVVRQVRQTLRESASGCEIIVGSIRHIADIIEACLEAVPAEPVDNLARLIQTDLTARATAQRMMRRLHC